MTAIKKVFDSNINLTQPIEYMNCGAFKEDNEMAIFIIYYYRVQHFETWLQRLSNHIK